MSTSPLARPPGQLSARDKASLSVELSDEFSDEFQAAFDEVLAESEAGEPLDDTSDLEPAHVREAVLAQVRARSTGQLDDLIGLPVGLVDLQLEPAAGTVSGPRAEEPAGPRPVMGIAEAFEASEGRLLVTGEPGSGKTILMYKLVDYLDRKAATDRAAPLPLIVNLSRWDGGTSLRQWLIEYLCDPVAGYGLRSHDLAAFLLDAHRFAVLLDGFDEVPAEHHLDCLYAINAHIGSLPPPPAAPLVITSRVSEYERLIAEGSGGGNGFRLFGAYEVRPLSRGNLVQNLALLARNAGTLQPTDGWTKVSDAISNGSVPFLSDVLSNPLMLAFAVGSRLDPLTLIDQPDAEGVTGYIVGCLYDRALADGNTSYETPDARRWLGWLASFMRREHGDDSMTFYLEDLVHGPAPRWLRTARGLGCGFGVGLVLTLSVGLAVGVASGLVAGLVSGLSRLDARPNRREFRRPSWRQLRVPLVASLALGLAGGLAWELESMALACFSAGGMFVLLNRMAKASRVDSVPEQPASPDSGLYESARSWLTETVIWMLSVGLAVGLLVVLRNGPSTVWLAGLSLGLTVGLSKGLDTGGGFVVRQIVERFRLRRAGLLPPDPVAFYDWATERDVLRRVGGGWQFQHLLLADLVTERYMSDQSAAQAR